MTPTDQPPPSRRWKSGDTVAWDIPHCGAAVVRLLGVGPDRITYESADGVVETAETTRYHTLAWATRNWREATEQERADFELRYRPAPENWN
ncbi:hypothetical protein [Kitasatospora sp. NPDC088783]|uniref:hypothetical protein n=1 Tax=Kitasatospora sp. NPDC088783 TaxID=3364077 RepID=UPI0038140A97